MIFWEQASLDDREAIFQYLHPLNPIAAEKTDKIIEESALLLEQQPLMGVERDNIPGRLLIIPEISILVSYTIIDESIYILRVLHQKQKFPL